MSFDHKTRVDAFFSLCFFVFDLHTITDVSLVRDIYVSMELLVSIVLLLVCFECLLSIVINIFISMTHLDLHTSTCRYAHTKNKSCRLYMNMLYKNYFAS